jgi:hypothetical protein
MTLRLNGSTSGYSEIEAPAVAGDQTFTLPGTGGNLLADTSNIEAQVKTATNASGSAPIYACRAWVNFNGTGSVAIRASGNVSSITDNGTGDYTVNFTTAMPDNNYAVSGSAENGGGNNSVGLNNATAPTSSAVRIGASNTNTGGLFDSNIVSIAVFR